MASSTASNADRQHQLPQSQAVSHVLSYPVINDLLHLALDTNPIGRTSKAITISVYETFGKPLVPYLYGFPCNYATPYVRKLDEISDSVLSRVDQAVPAVRKPTNEAVADARAAAEWPVRRYCEIYSREMSNASSSTAKRSTMSGSASSTNGASNVTITTKGYAAINSLLVLASEVMTMAGDFVATAQRQAQTLRSHSEKKSLDLTKDAYAAIDNTASKAREEKANATVY